MSLRESRNNSGWESVALSDCAQYHNGIAFRPAQCSAEGTKIIRIEQLNNPTGPYDCCAGDFPNTSLIDNGDLIFAWSATLKACIWKHGRGVLNQHLFKVIPSSNIDKQFLFYVLDYNMEALSGGSHGSTMRHIKRSELKRFFVSIPTSLQEQREISSILSCIDSNIDQTHSLIAKYHAIKQGMMQDLFTRGIDETGQLRPPYTMAPGYFKESELGFVPKNWALKTFRDITESKAPICYGILQPGEYFEGGVPVVAINSLQNGFVDLHRCHPTIEAKYTRSRITGGDVLISVKGTIGRVDVVPQSFNGNISRDVARIRPNSKLSPQYLYHLLTSPLMQGLIEGAIVGTTRAELSIGILRNLFLPVPEIEEQRAIAQHLYAIDALTENEKQQLLKLKMIKSGLMQDLLTGKIRVKVDEPTESAQDVGVHQS